MVNWRHVNGVVHRDVGYFFAALTVVYAVSGVAVNHTHEWNPSYKVERVERTFQPVPVGEREEMVTALVARLDLPRPVSSFRSAPHLVDLFYDGWNVKADAFAGTATIERPRERPFLRDANFLHLNHPKGIWTWMADLYAVALGFLAVSGLFILRGKTGLAGRGKWFLLAGVVLPLAYLVAVRYLGGRPSTSASTRSQSSGMASSTSGESPSPGPNVAPPTVSTKPGTSTP
jgi:hypothetical protein